MASEYTQNRRYPLYTDSDKPNLRDQYNGAIREIDADMAQALSDSSGVASALGAGFDAQHTVRMELDAVNTRIDGVDSSLTSLGSDISAEETARQNADNSLSTAISNEATTRQNADNSLSTAISNEATTRQNADNTLDSKITADRARITELENKAFKYYGKNIICVTDSWGTEGTHNVTTCWMHRLCDNLGANYIDLHQGSTGFVRSPNYQTRLATWIASNPSMVNDIDYVMVCGSSNDYSYSVVDIRDAIESFVSYALSALPNATVILFPQFANDNMSLTNIAVSAGNNPWVKASQAAALFACTKAARLNPRFMYVPFGEYIFLNKPDYFNSDHVHPNQSGHDVLAGYAYNSLTKGFGLIKAINPDYISFTVAELSENRAQATAAQSQLSQYMRCGGYIENNMLHLHGNGPVSFPSGLTNGIITFGYKLLLPMCAENTALNAGTVIAQQPSGDFMTGVIETISPTLYKAATSDLYCTPFRILTSATPEAGNVRLNFNIDIPLNYNPFTT